MAKSKVEPHFRFNQARTLITALLSVAVLVSVLARMAAGQISTCQFFILSLMAIISIMAILNGNKLLDQASAQSKLLSWSAGTCTLSGAPTVVTRPQKACTRRKTSGGGRRRRRACAAYRHYTESYLAAPVSARVRDADGAARTVNQNIYDPARLTCGATAGGSAATAAAVASACAPAWTEKNMSASALFGNYSRGWAAVQAQANGSSGGSVECWFEPTHYANLAAESGASSRAAGAASARKGGKAYHVVGGVLIVFPALALLVVLCGAAGGRGGLGGGDKRGEYDSVRGGGVV